MQKYLANSISNSSVKITYPNNSTSTATASTTASASAYNATDADIIANNISSSLSIQNLNMQTTDPNTIYENSIVTNSTITKTCDCSNYDMSCNEAYYENLLQTWGEKNPTNNPNFLWGASTSAFQIEGSLKADGRGPTIWDVFQEESGKIANGDTADIATNSYVQYKDDVKLLLNMNCNAYRFSISWTRILPNGKGEVNQDGINHYNKIIDELIFNGITPIVTLYHWDLPQALELEYHGWLCSNKEIASDFANYADICFAAFGDRVKNWATINELQTTSINAFEYNYFAPAKGNSQGISQNGIEYLAGHNQLLAHSAAVQVYREKYFYQNGKIGIVCNCDAAVPYSDKVEDIEAAYRNFEFWFCWFYDPIFFGNYPQTMIDLVGDRLPKFTKEEEQLIQGSCDVMYWNTYSAKYFKAYNYDSTEVGWTYDQKNQSSTTNSEGCLIGPPSQSSWLQITPFAPKLLLIQIQNRYGTGPKSGIQMKLKNGNYKNIPLILTELGVDILNQDETTSYEVAKKDCERIFFYKSYLENITEALELTGINMIGFCPWALVDNFEWTSGYTCRFGINYVDYLSFPEYRPRLPKYSSLWYRDFISSHPNGLL